MPGHPANTHPGMEFLLGSVEAALQVLRLD
jgi:hypothetical protein